MESRLIPYLSFKDAKEALNYYEEVFGATNGYRMAPTTEQAEQFGLSNTENLEEMTIHGGFRLLDLQFMLADAFMGEPATSTQIMLMLAVNEDDAESVKALEVLYQKVAASDTIKVTFPLADQPWGGKLGQVTDQYGITWQFSAASFDEAPGAAL